jgi:hypothetical protein
MHPDKFSQADDSDRESAELAFKRVQKAYEVGGAGGGGASPDGQGRADCPSAREGSA